PTEKQREETEGAVQRLVDITAHGHQGRRTLLNWLLHEFDIEKPTHKLQDVATLDANALAVEVQKARGKKKPLTAAETKALATEHARSVVPLQALATEARQLERR